MAMHEDIIHFPLPSSSEEPAAVIETSGISYCDGSYRISRRNSNKYVFEYVVKGHGFINSPAGVFTPATGDVYILHCGASYTYGSSSEDPWVKIWFNARGRIIKELIECYGLNNVWHIPDCNLEELFREERQKLLQTPERAHTIIGVIVHKIICAVSERMETHKPLAVSEDGLKLKRYIDSRLHAPLSLTEMAEQINKSISQTVRIFRRDWNTTPYDYMLNKRIELARIYLSDTAKPVKEIASDLNFADEYYFANMFKRKTGLTPTAYRKM